MMALRQPDPGGGRELAELTLGLVAVPQDIRVSDVTLDSREVRPGALFLACRGQARHGLAFAAEALARGARAILYDPSGSEPMRPLECGRGVFTAAVVDLAGRAGLIADRFFGQPSRALATVGITGTNGKTTCAWLLAQALGRCGRPAAYLGTLGFGFPGELTAATHTTADAVNIHRRLARMRELGAEWAAMEVSSHALDQQRIAAVRIHTAVFTNLTRDHLDYHGTMSAYAEAKSKLFAAEGLVNRVINIDDAFGAQLARRGGAGCVVATARRSAPGERPAAARWVRGGEARPAGLGLRMHVASSWGEGDLEVPLIGEFNADNALTVLAVLLAADVPLSRALPALGQCRAAPGRMETFGGEDLPLVIVDYAHTPDALAKALRSARQHCRGRLRVVFGCGGDRDAGKRPMMGRLAGELADELILTDDNPRSEPPERITADILAGIDSPQAVTVQHDRAAAIALAVARSERGDVALIAGKGHESYQIYGAEQRPFRDQSVVTEALGRRAEPS